MRARFPKSYSSEEVLELARADALNHRRAWDELLAKARRDRDNEVIHFDSIDPNDDHPDPEELENP